MDRDTDSRLSSLETSVTLLAKKVDELATSFGQARKIDWTSIWGGLTVLLVVIGSVGKSYISPIETRLMMMEDSERSDRRDFSTRLDVVSEGMIHNTSRIETHSAIFANKLTEVETQFRWLNDVLNLRDRQAHLLTALLWEETFKKPLPSVTLPDAGPGSQGVRPTEIPDGH